MLEKKSSEAVLLFGDTQVLAYPHDSRMEGKMVAV